MLGRVQDGNVAWVRIEEQKMALAFGPETMIDKTKVIGITYLLLSTRSLTPCSVTGSLRENHCGVLATN